MAGSAAGGSMVSFDVPSMCIGDYCRVFATIDVSSHTKFGFTGTLITDTETYYQTSGLDYLWTSDDGSGNAGSEGSILRYLAAPVKSSSSRSVAKRVTIVDLVRRVDGEENGGGKWTLIAASSIGRNAPVDSVNVYACPG